jgi:hypothetical protein
LPRFQRLRGRRRFQLTFFRFIFIIDAAADAAMPDMRAADYRFRRAFSFSRHLFSRRQHAAMPDISADFAAFMATLFATLPLMPGR